MDDLTEQERRLILTLRLLRSFSLIVHRPVSLRVGNVKNNDPSLIEPMAGLG
jgi:hypothetical protein